MTWRRCILEFRQLTLSTNKQAGGTNGQQHKGGNTNYQNFDLTRAGRDEGGLFPPRQIFPRQMIVNISDLPHSLYVMYAFYQCTLCTIAVW